MPWSPLVALGLAAAIAHATLQIVPGATWTAAGGARGHMQAHGAGVVKVGPTFYLIGEDRSDGANFVAINCYSSTDLAQWTYVGALLSRTAAGGDLGPGRVVERPKVLHNAKTGRYVLYVHIDDQAYAENKVGVATGSEVCGEYTYRGSARPLGHPSRDIGLFQDEDGSAYLLSEDKVAGLRINALAPDYLSVASEVHTFSDIEAPAILKRGDTYFMFGSHLTGWALNDNVYSFAKSLSGPWSDWQTFAAPNSRTYDSQTTFILPLSATTAVYMGDRWEADKLASSTYVWLPLTISGTAVTMANAPAWVPSVDGGTAAPVPAAQQATHEAEAATLSAGARAVPCGGCSGGRAVGSVGGPGKGAVAFAGLAGTGAATTVQIRYVNRDGAARRATVTCGEGGDAQVVAFLPTRGDAPGTSVVTCALGDTLQIAPGPDQGPGPDVDCVIVPA